jgi:tRNA pseudouridine55 synthase
MTPRAPARGHADASPLHGVLVVDKPEGPTSHDVVDAVRRALRVRRVGHTGTLDPFATGVLPVCVGKATRLARFLGGGDKTYRATVRLGLATTTDDRMGEPLGPARPVTVEPETVEAALASLRRRTEQIPPTYSAKHVGGRRAYELAREGLDVPRRPVAVAIHALDLLERRGDELTIEVRCSPGTYVRALARDLGEALGVGGHLTALRRTRSGAFGLDESVTLQAVEGEGARRLVPLARLLPELPAVRVGREGRAALTHGRDLDSTLVVGGLPEEPGPRLRVLDEDGALVALVVPRGFATTAELPVTPTLHPDLVLVD